MATIKETGEEISTERADWMLLKFRIEEEGRSACFLVRPKKEAVRVTYSSIEEILWEGWEPCGGDGAKIFLFKRGT